MDQGSLQSRQNPQFGQTSLQWCSTIRSPQRSHVWTDGGIADGGTTVASWSMPYLRVPSRAMSTIPCGAFALH
jgi:hypothetical protein